VAGKFQGEPTYQGLIPELNVVDFCYESAVLFVLIMMMMIIMMMIKKY